MNWSLITAVNDEAVLHDCLARSPSLARARDFNVMRGFASAGAAYNAAMRQAAGDVLVFAHQDVYLPDDWEEHLDAAISRLSRTDPQWGVLGVFGITRELKPGGHLYCTGLQRVLGQTFAEPIEAGSLDECLLVLRRTAGLQFDEQLPGFHLYGTDICLEAKRRGLKSYIVPAFCIHNTRGLDFLPLAFWKSYFYMRRKWHPVLPVRTPCTTISRWPLAVVDHPIRSAYALFVKGEKAGGRSGDPCSLYEQLRRTQALPSMDQ